MLEQLGSTFRKLSVILCLVGLLAIFYTLGFANIALDRSGRPKPPLWVQLLQSGALFASGLPGVIWGITRAVQNK
jgi:hypothetical protein